MYLKHNVKVLLQAEKAEQGLGMYKSDKMTWWISRA